MKRFNHRGNNMQMTPSASTENLESSMTRMLKENQALQPQMLLMFEQAALMMREKQLAFIRAGFTDAQAFILASK